MIAVDRHGEGVIVSPSSKRARPRDEPSKIEQTLRRKLYWYGLHSIGMTQQEIASDSGFHRSTVGEAIIEVGDRLACREGCGELERVLRSMLNSIHDEF